MSQIVRLLQNGFMDKDTDLQLVSGGNYIDAQNIRHREDSGANMTGISPVKGNSLKVTIPDPVTSVTRWRVFVKAVDPYSLDGSISIINSSGVLVGPSTFAGSLVSTSLLVSSINTGTDQIVFTTVHGLTNSQIVNYYNAFGSLATPLVNGGAYFAKVINTTTIELYTDAALTIKVDITSAGSGTQSFASSPIAAVVTQVQSMLTGLSAGFVYSSVTYTTSSTAYFDVTHSTFNDFEILETGNIIDYAVQTSEYVNFIASPAKFKIIGMESVGNDTIVFSTTGNFLSSSYYTPYRSLCEIGVVQYVQSTDSYTYTRLLRSKQLNFNVDYQIQAQVEKRTQDVNIYWTDGVNKPRVLSVPYPYIQDGVLTSNGGTIDISKVDKETTLFIDTPSATISYTEIVEGGGSVSCGNKRYTGRFVTDDFVGTDYLYPTGLINIFKAPLSVPSEVKGDEPGTLTNKAIKLQLSNIPPGEFTYFELVAIEYQGETFTANMVQRYRLNNESTIEVIHSNNGQENLPLSIPELLALTAKVTQVKSLRINSNRLFLANVNELVDYDLSLWAQSITHSLEIKQISSVGRSNRFGKNDTGKAYPNYKLGEYQDPYNVFNFTGYMMNDTYRFGIQVQWKETGKWSSPFWVDDIRFDLLATNVTTPSRRSANNITTTNITNLDLDYVNIYHVKFNNIDLSYQVNGQPLYRLIKSFRFVRADRIPEVLATGILIGAVEEKDTVGTNLIPYHKDISHSAFTFSTFPASFCRRDRGPNFQTTTFVDNIQLGITNYSEYGYFHSPDIYFNQASYTYEAGDRLNILSVPVPFDEFTLQGFSKGDYESVYQEYTGYYDNVLRSYTNFAIVAARNFETGEITNWDVFDKVKNGVSVPPEGVPVIGVNPFYSNMKACTVFKFGSKVSTSFPGEVGLFATGSGTYQKEGLVYCQIFRDKGNTLKYPVDKSQTTYETTNHLYILTGSERGVLNGVSVFGGDVFNQKSHLKIRMTTNNDLNNGFGLAYSFYSQNITNTQMLYTLEHNDEQAGPGHLYPQYMDKFSTGLNLSGYLISGSACIRDWSPTFTTIQERTSSAISYGIIPEGSWGTGLLNWLEQWPEIDNQNNYDSQYSVIDNTFSEIGYNPDNRWDGKRPASIRWSQIKSTGSEKDSYRIFKPIDVVDLDMNQGEIIELESVNGNLYSLQPNSFTRHYVGDSQMMMTDQGTEIILGSGGVLTNKGQQLSSFGATNKTAITKGKTFSGDENLYWYNSETKKIVRFGGDGTRVLSDKGLMSYLMNNTDWHTDLLKSISGQGVTAGYNQRFYEAMFTFKAVDPAIQEFQKFTDTTYSTYVQYAQNTLVVLSHQGDVTSFNYYLEDETADRHISGVPFIYRKKNTATDTANTVPQFGPSWANNWDKLTPDTHPQYYRIFTLVYDEVKNGFICFHSMWPNIMTTRGNTVYTSKPNEQNKIYVHNGGNYNTFYDTQYNGHIEGVVNIDPNLSKTFEAVQVVSDTTPDRLDFGTRDHISFLTSAEFEELEDFYYSPVKNDSTVTGTNSGDTSRLWGRYMKIKMRFAPNLFQKLINYVIKYRANPRLYNK